MNVMVTCMFFSSRSFGIKLPRKVMTIVPVYFPPKNYEVNKNVDKKIHMKFLIEKFVVQRHAGTC